MVWAPRQGTTFRGAYTRSLGGLFYDTSVRLEPVQVAGFTQAYRSLVPESVAGSIAGTRVETVDLGVEQKFWSATYVVLSAEALNSHAGRDVGVFEVDESGNTSASVSKIGENLEYEEYSFAASLYQLVGREWSLGARYRASEATLKTQFPEVPAQLETQFPNDPAALIPYRKNRGLLHDLNLFAIYNHPSGIFAEGQASWASQSNGGYPTAPQGHEFWQFNLFAGYRFPRRQAEIRVGVLNLTDQDYRLNPLNLYTELPRHRLLTTTLKFNF